MSKVKETTWENVFNILSFLTSSRGGEMYQQVADVLRRTGSLSHYYGGGYMGRGVISFRHKHAKESPQ